jgi:hypothetical protein
VYLDKLILISRLINLIMARYHYLCGYS